MFAPKLFTPTYSPGIYGSRLKSNKPNLPTLFKLGVWYTGVHQPFYLTIIPPLEAVVAVPIYMLSLYRPASSIDSRLSVSVEEDDCLSMAFGEMARLLCQSINEPRVSIDI